MNIGKACAVFMQIESDKYTDAEKAIAISRVLGMATHNGITKDAMLAAIKYQKRICGELAAKDAEIAQLTNALSEETKRANEVESTSRMLRKNANDLRKQRDGGSNDREHWKAYAESLERAIKSFPPDNQCDCCTKSFIRATCENCDENYSDWHLDLSRFTGITTLNDGSVE